MSNSGKSLSETLVKDVMTRALISADPGTTVYQISKIMEQGIGAVLIKKDGVPAGIITDRDFAIKIASKNLPMDTPVEKVASYPLQTINQNESILQAAKKLAEKKIRKLAAIDDGKVVGIITSTDLINQIASS